MLALFTPSVDPYSVHAVFLSHTLDDAILSVFPFRSSCIILSTSFFFFLPQSHCNPLSLFSPAFLLSLPLCLLPFLSSPFCLHRLTIWADKSSLFLPSATEFELSFFHVLMAELLKAKGTIH